MKYIKIDNKQLAEVYNLFFRCYSYNVVNNLHL